MPKDFHSPRSAGFDWMNKVRMGGRQDGRKKTLFGSHDENVLELILLISFFVIDSAGTRQEVMNIDDNRLKLSGARKSSSSIDRFVCEAESEGNKIEQQISVKFYGE